MTSSLLITAVYTSSFGTVKVQRMISEPVISYAIDDIIARTKEDIFHQLKNIVEMDEPLDPNLIFWKTEKIQQDDDMASRYIIITALQAGKEIDIITGESIV